MGISVSDRSSLPVPPDPNIQRYPPNSNRSAPAETMLAGFGGSTPGSGVESENDILNMGVTLAGLDPALKGTIDAMVPTGKVQFVVVDDASKAAAEAGFKNFKGDAFTATVQVRDQNGRPKSTQAVIYIEQSALETMGKATVVLQHEFYHIKRAIEGRSSSDRNREEFETFKESIGGTDRLSRKFYSMAETISDSNQRQAVLRTANQMRALLKNERELLESYRGRAG